MTDFNYWKRKYEHLWSAASSREERIRAILVEETGRSMAMYGFGAGTDEFLSGPPSGYARETGDPDLVVEGTPILVEVTGPLLRQGPDKSLWLRPDKIENARRSSKDHCVVHEDGESGLLRAIHLNERFFVSLDRGEFAAVHPLIRGARETYILIPHDHCCVRPFSMLVEYMRNYGGERDA